MNEKVGGNKTMTEKNRPVHEIRIASIRAAIWRNGNNGKIWHSVSITRRYREKEGGEWRDSNSFAGLGDLAHVQLAVELAIEWLAQHDVQQGSAEE